MKNAKANFKTDFSKRLIRFSLSVVRLATKIKEDRILWAVADQVLRSGTSIGANVTEASSSSSKREYVHYFEIALKSANETKYWLTILQEGGYSETEAKALHAECSEIARILASSILTMKGKKSF